MIKLVKRGINKFLISISRIERYIMPFFNKSKGVKKVFIVSSGRTGTLSLAFYLNMPFSLIRAYHEPHPQLRDLCYYFLKEVITLKRASEIFKKKRESLICTGIRFYIESNGRLFGLLPVIHKAYPEAKIIHIIRDGRDYVRTSMSRAFGYERPNPDDKIGRYAITSNLFGDKFKGYWDSFDKFQKFAWYWKYCNEIMERDGKLFDGNYILLKFEEIFKGNHEGMDKLLNFIGIRTNYKKKLSRKYNATKHRFPHHSNWNDDLKKAFNLIAGDYLEHSGYEVM